MVRRWCIPLTTIALVFGSLMAAAGGANAAVPRLDSIPVSRTSGRAARFTRSSRAACMQRPTGALARAHGSEPGREHELVRATP